MNKFTKALITILIWYIVFSIVMYTVDFSSWGIVGRALYIILTSYSLSKELK